MIWHMLLREIAFRKLNFALGLLAVAIAVGALVGTLTMLKIHDIHTREILKQKEAETQKKLAVLNDEMRKATLKLDFNLLILPKEQSLQEWHLKGHVSAHIPEDYVTRLANSGIVFVRHFLPLLQQKIKWPEKRRTIILVGARDEVPNPHKSPRTPLVQPVPAGTIVLGSALWQSMGIEVGDKVRLMGKELIVHKCHEKRGSKDDIMAWISLDEAQELLKREGLINAIYALECLCVGHMEVAMVRAKIAEILPGTQVLEMGAKKLAREEARLKLKQQTKELVKREKQDRAHLRAEREGFCAVLVPAVMVASVIWIGILGFGNVRDRQKEIGILRAIGFRARHIMTLFLFKSLLTGLVGGLLGCLAGTVSGNYLGRALESGAEPVSALHLPLDARLLVLTVLMASVLTVVVGWIPAILASQADPAVTLRKE